MAGAVVTVATFLDIAGASGSLVFVVWCVRRLVAAYRARHFYRFVGALTAKAPEVLNDPSIRQLRPPPWQAMAIVAGAGLAALANAAWLLCRAFGVCER